jgi:hypothetical protein
MYVPTPEQLAMLRKIGQDGAYGSDFDDDDQTNETLCEVLDAGLVRGEGARFDDYFILTEFGLAAIKEEK